MELFLLSIFISTFSLVRTGAAWAYVCSRGGLLGCPINSEATEKPRRCSGALEMAVTPPCLLLQASDIAPFSGFAASSLSAFRAARM